jgi:hypothetical protein
MTLFPKMRDHSFYGTDTATETLGCNVKRPEPTFPDLL